MGTEAHLAVLVTEERPRRSGRISIWSLIVGQLPWVVSVLFGFGFVYSRIESRLTNIEQRLTEIRAAQVDYLTRGEARLMQAQTDQRITDQEKRVDRLERAAGR